MPNPFAHVELHSDDVQKSKKFYKSLFAWKLNDIPGMNYTMIDVGGGTGGGIGEKMMPNPGWLSYVQVDSVKKAIAKAQKLGATIVTDYQPIGDMGAIGVFVDPSGAALGVWEKGKAAKAPAKKKAAKKSAKKKR